MTPFAGGIPIRPHIKVFPPEKKQKIRSHYLCLLK